MSATMDTLWYENEQGERWVPDMSGELEPPPPGFLYQHSRFPWQVTENVLRLVQRDEVEACEHPDVVPTGGWIDGLEGRKCRSCGGHQVRETSEPWPDEWDAEGCDPFYSVSTGYPADLVLALTRPTLLERTRQVLRYGWPAPTYGYTQAVLRGCGCERCINALAHRHGLSWGYREGSKAWSECGTSCDACAPPGVQA